MAKKTKVEIMAACLVLSKDWGERAVHVKTLIEDKCVTEQQQVKAVKATARTYEKCALELAALFKEGGG